MSRELRRGTMSTLTSVTRTAWAQPAGALPPTSGGGAHREPANAGGGCGHEGVPRGGAARAGRTQHCGWITPEELTYSEAKRPEARQTKSPGADECSGARESEGRQAGKPMTDGNSKARPSAAAIARAECSGATQRAARVVASRKQSGGGPPALQTELADCRSHPRRNAQRSASTLGAKSRAHGAQRAAPPTTAVASRTRVQRSRRTLLFRERERRAFHSASP